MWMMPLHLHVNQKSDYDDDDDSSILTCKAVFLITFHALKTLGKSFRSP